MCIMRGTVRAHTILPYINKMHYKIMTIIVRVANKFCLTSANRSSYKTASDRTVNGNVGTTKTGRTYASHVAFNLIRTELIPSAPAVLTEKWTTMIIDLNSLTLSSLQ